MMKQLMIGCLAATLSACVTSEHPLLGEGGAIADKTLTGRWVSEVEGKLTYYRVSLTGKRYTITKDGTKDIEIATVHRIKDKMFLVQMKDQKEKTYQYMMMYPLADSQQALIDAGLCNKDLAATIGVNPITADSSSCEIGSEADLKKIAEYAAGHPISENDFASAYLKLNGAVK